MFKIGSYNVPSRILLAPMAGCTDLAFRLISRDHGAKFCFFEMVDCNSITYGVRHRVRSILKSLPEDTPIAAQLLGRGPDVMLRGAREILKLTKASFLDINAACPAKKVVKKRAGSYLLTDEHELSKILKRLSTSLNVPVTVKIRTGYVSTDISSLMKLAKLCESSGAQAIFIHGRTKAQGYAGEIDYKAIKAVKEEVGIPVIGSGNVFDAISAKKMFKETGCDAVFVARGALGNPWIFRELETIDAGSSARPAIAFKERIKVLKRHLAYIDRHKDCSPSGKAGFMRKVVLWYLRGFPNAPRIRSQISVVNSYEKMLKLLDTL